MRRSEDGADQFGRAFDQPAFTASDLETRALVELARSCARVAIPAPPAAVAFRLDRRFERTLASARAPHPLRLSFSQRPIQVAAGLFLVFASGASAASAMGASPSDVLGRTVSFIERAAVNLVPALRGNGGPGAPLVAPKLPGVAPEDVPPTGAGPDPGSPPTDGDAARPGAAPAGGTPVASDRPAAVPAIDTRTPGATPTLTPRALPGLVPNPPRLPATPPATAWPGASPSPAPPATATPMLASSPTATPTPPPASTNTPAPTATPTGTPPPTATATPTAPPTPTAPATATPSPTATPVPATLHTYPADTAGTVTLKIEDHWLTVLSVGSTPGWAVVLDKAAGSDVQVVFTNGPRTTKFWASVTSGVVTVLVEVSQ